VGGCLAALVSWLLALWAGVNGRNYDAWSHALAAFTFAIVVADAVALVLLPALDRRRLALAAACLIVSIISGVITIHWFGDGHAATSVAAVLAWIAFSALLLCAAALSLPAFRRPGS